MPQPFYPQERDKIFIVQEGELVSQTVCAGVENLLPPGFDPWTVQPAANCYTNYTILAHARKEITERIVHITKHASRHALNFCIALSYKCDLLIIILLVNLFQGCYCCVV